MNNTAKTATTRTGKLIPWLLEQPIGGVVPTLDKCILIFLKIVYIGLRILLRIALGKEKRDRLYAKLLFNITYFSISIFLFTFFYRSITFLGLSKPKLLKIRVPKYNYKVYCPVSKEDFIVMTKHEDEIIGRFTPNQGDIVVDVGAHMGRYTIIASMRVGPTGKVIAIEASPINFEMLNRNTNVNQLTNVISLNYAVYSKETKINLYLPDEEKGCTIYNTVMVGRARTEEDRFVTVNANTLDSLLLLQQQNGISPADINWIKIDVEGAEFEVLKGATNILSKSKDIRLLIEIHNLPGGTNFYAPIVEFLSSFNFKIEFEKAYEGGERHIIVQK
jgi:FkbM family methyltransferase